MDQVTPIAELAICAAICLVVLAVFRRMFSSPESDLQTHVAPPPEQIPIVQPIEGFPGVSQHLPDSAQTLQGAPHVPQRGLADLLPESFVVVDLETTGLNPETDEIIEIGAIKVALSSTTHIAFQMLVKPRSRIPRNISDMTRITQTMVDTDGVTISNALAQFLEFIGDLPLVTYNADFDMGFLWTAAKSCGLTIGNSYACALKRARRAWPGLPNYRLATLAKLGGLSIQNTHRAVGDCERALIVFTSATSVLGQRVRWSKPVSSIV